MLVVGAALVRGSSVLAALRHDPPGWEFPGGKVEVDESPQQAIERECREELGITASATRCLATVCDARIELQLWHVDLVSGEPLPLDHAELRWVAVADLDSLGWLAIDRELLPAVHDLLG